MAHALVAAAVVSALPAGATFEAPEEGWSTSDAWIADVNDTGRPDCDVWSRVDSSLSMVSFYSHESGSWSDWFGWMDLSIRGDPGSMVRDVGRTECLSLLAAEDTFELGCEGPRAGTYDAYGNWQQTGPIDCPLNAFYGDNAARFSALSGRYDPAAHTFSFDGTLLDGRHVVIATPPPEPLVRLPSLASPTP